MVTTLQPFLPGAKWTRPGDAHFTLEFLGEVPSGRVDDIKRLMKSAVGDRHSFSMAFGGLGAFPDWKKPKVIWLGVSEGAAELERIQSSLHEELGRAGFQLEDRSFHPHLTLCRISSPGGMDKFKAAAEPLAEGKVWAGSAMTVHSIDLIESQLRPDGAVYIVKYQETLCQSD